MKRLWYVDCPACDQGRLFVQRRSDSANLFLQCEECYTAWPSPSHVDRNKDWFFSMDIPCDDATSDDVVAAGWSMYKFHEAND
jgi:hypothetical protein